MSIVWVLSISILSSSSSSINEVGVLGDRVALGLIFVFDDLARLGVDKLAFHPVAGLAIDGVERDARRRARGRIEVDSAGDQRKFQVTLPARSWGHDAYSANSPTPEQYGKHLPVVNPSMTISAQKVYVYGRLRGITARRICQLAVAKRLRLTRRPSSADAIVLAHSTVGSAVSDGGELRLRFQRKADARLVSERFFRSQLGILALPGASEPQYSEDQIARHAGLNSVQLRTLSLYDVVSSVDSGFSYSDLLAARAVGRLIAAGAKFPKIIVAALALEQPRGEPVCRAARRSAVGELLQVFEGALAEIDGQLLLPLHGPDMDADEAFARAEASEQEGDLDSARRWYDLAGAPR